jgi:hypothetical protein
MGVTVDVILGPLVTLAVLARVKSAFVLRRDLTIIGISPEDVVALPLTGPTLLSLRPFKDSNERLQAILVVLQGAHLGACPDLCQSYVNGVADILKQVKPVSTLLGRFPAQVNTIDRLQECAGRKADGVVYLPMIGRNQSWAVFLDASTGQLATTMPLDSF